MYNSSIEFAGFDHGLALDERRNRNLKYATNHSHDTINKKNLPSRPPMGLNQNLIRSNYKLNSNLKSNLQVMTNR